MNEHKTYIVGEIVACIAILALFAFLGVNEYTTNKRDTQIAQTCISAGGTWTEGKANKPSTCKLP